MDELRKSYTHEQKLKAVTMHLEDGFTVKDSMRHIGCKSKSAFFRWCAEEWLTVEDFTKGREADLNERLNDAIADWLFVNDLGPNFYLVDDVEEVPGD